MSDAPRDKQFLLAPAEGRTSVDEVAGCLPQGPVVSPRSAYVGTRGPLEREGRVT